MKAFNIRRLIQGFIVICCCFVGYGDAQQSADTLSPTGPEATMSGKAPSAAANPTGDRGMMMLTIFLRHDESKTLDEINAHLKQTGFSKNFPPAGTEVVSWYVMMGVGQVVTLRFPPQELREVNLAIEHGAWGAFRTEFYPTYDYKPVWEAQKQSGTATPR